MRWWRFLLRGTGKSARDPAQEEARAAAAMARLRGQCGVAAGECVPWDAPDPRDGKKAQGAGDERR